MTQVNIGWDYSVEAVHKAQKKTDMSVLHITTPKEYHSSCHCQEVTEVTVQICHNLLLFVQCTWQGNWMDGVPTLKYAHKELKRMTAM